MTPGKRTKQRLDFLLVAQGLAADLDTARRLIGAGLVLADTRICDKSGQMVAADSKLALRIVQQQPLTPGKRTKQRLDFLLVAQGLAADLDTARRLIGAGLVLADTRICDKSGQMVAADSKLALRIVQRKFVSRGGEKLDGSLRAAGIDPAGWVCADIGCSTGGFTDCLLQHGARKVYSVDVGYGLLDWKLRQDKRVVVLERTNARQVTNKNIADPLDLAVIDASFISLEPLLAPLLPLFGDCVRIFALVKPQFQLPRQAVGPGGIVNDPEQHGQALAMVRQFGEALGLRCAAVVASPVLGAKGNQEFFMLLTGPAGREQK